MFNLIVPDKEKVSYLYSLCDSFSCSLRVKEYM